MENGPLRVITGSHEAGLLSAEGIRAQVGKVGQVECCLPKGGILAMRPLLIHASSKARTNAPRRVLHIKYADSLQLAPGIRLAIARNCRRANAATPTNTVTVSPCARQGLHRCGPERHNQDGATGREFQLPRSCQVLTGPPLLQFDHDASAPATWLNAPEPR